MFLKKLFAYNCFVIADSDSYVLFFFENPSSARFNSLSNLTFALLASPILAFYICFSSHSSQASKTLLNRFSTHLTPLCIDFQF